jgi:acyl-CoA thioester hydrolase
LNKKIFKGVSIPYAVGMNSQTHFHHPITIEPTDIDQLQHVNNEVYLRWLMQAASAHSKAAGFGMEYFVRTKKAFVVRRHEIDYLLPALLGDELLIKTWIDSYKGARSYRRYELWRGEKKLVEANTLWVYIDLTTGRPIEIDSAMIVEYHKVQI